MTQETEQQGIPEIFREECALVGVDSNIFSLLGVVKKHLREQGRQWLKDGKMVDGEEPVDYFRRKSDEMFERVKKSGSYDEALNMLWDYVNIV